MVIVDGAQSAGQVPVNLHELGVDVYAMAGQKWLCGPEGSGLVYMRRDRFADIGPATSATASLNRVAISCRSKGLCASKWASSTRQLLPLRRRVFELARVTTSDSIGPSRASLACASDFRRRLSQIDRGLHCDARARHGRPGELQHRRRGIPRKVTEASSRADSRFATSTSQPCALSARASIGWWNTEARNRRSGKRGGGHGDRWVRRHAEGRLRSGLFCGRRAIVARSASRSTSMASMEKGNPASGRHVLVVANRI